jgi:hypothetical protein
MGRTTIAASTDTSCKTPSALADIRLALNISKSRWHFAIVNEFAGTFSQQIQSAVGAQPRSSASSCTRAIMTVLDATTQLAAPANMLSLIQAKSTGKSERIRLRLVDYSAARAAPRCRNR